MADDDKAQCDALAAVFGDNPTCCFLMCFYHVMKKVQAAIKPLSSVAQATILREVYDQHFARKEAAYLELMYTIMRRWFRERGLIPFTPYI
ncbi:hypothetical protein PI124_g17622 [Phytophthora idaei]|nr:hypothetical protein PI125_g18230 [Phytophthora idaei]KAG3138486.1 hypothetical protein PI126_g16893 [Phytophthora idaei]KAG3237383.1 hypothetical protein PI124_g17622 [Phytophthora idaei]